MKRRLGDNQTMRQGDFHWVGRDRRARREGAAAAGCGGGSGSRLPQSRIGVWLSALCSLLFAHSASAQWQSTTFELKGGWNSIYLHGDATHDTIDDLFPAEVIEVWRWNPNPTQVQFTTDPLIPTPGTPEWTTWYRGNEEASKLSALIGQTAYLIKCTGTTANNYSVPITHRPQPPSNVWVRNGANLLGFPTFKNGANYPTMSSYFATFPAAIAANTKIFKYVGGDLGPGNPLQIFSPTFEQVDRNQAYWFDAEVVGSFYAPIEISPTVSGGLEFGRTRSIIAVRLRNRTSAAVTITVTPENSGAAPAGQTGVVGPVPLTRRTFDTGSNQYVETAISGAFNEVIGPQSSVEIEFGIDRGSLSANSNDFYASFLKFTDSSNLMEVFLPASAQPSTMAGLWVGDVEVTDVGSKAAHRARAVATLTDAGEVESISVDYAGTNYDTAPTVTITDPISGTTATAIAAVDNGEVTAITVQSAGSGYVTTPLVTVDAPPPLTGTGVARSFPLRYLLHVDDGGTARLLSQVFTGILDLSGEYGVCAFESALKQDAKATATRMVCTHMPLDQILSAGAGSVALGGTLTRTISLPFDDKVNPFVHQYHPDHDNKDARFKPVSAGTESFTVTRAVSFDFLASPPPGTSSTGWGTTILGGDYAETLTGAHRQPLTTSGTFTFRRVNDIGSINITP